MRSGRSLLHRFFVFRATAGEAQLRRACLVDAWRCGAKVEKRDLDQWYLRVTKYADELLDFDGLDWPESIKAMQTNWIGRSEGGEIEFTTAPSAHHAGGEPIRVFTTRPDTLFGATFMVLAPEHPLVASLTAPERRAEVDEQGWFSFAPLPHTPFRLLWRLTGSGTAMTDWLTL